MRKNILRAVANQDATAFLNILDNGFKQAAKAASVESHALGLDVVDGRRRNSQAQQRNDGSRCGWRRFEPDDS